MQPFEALDSTLDIVPMEQKAKELKKATPRSIVVADKEEDKERDYQHIRTELYSLIEKGQTIIDEVMDVAGQSQHPRAYEVAINSVKSVSEVAEKLMDLHKKMNDVANEETKISQTNVQNNVFVAGTTSEIMKMLKDANASK